jgi:3-deoxy-D-manno-octulosonate 8-phosphate phosphatase (KDO 8-P phosphatase)
MKNLGIELVYQGQENKISAFKEVLNKVGCLPEQVAYMGDDLLDLPIMCRVGLAIAVHDAVPVVKDYAHWVTDLCGGDGAVREVGDLIMQAQGNFEAVVAAYLQ